MTIRHVLIASTEPELLWEEVAGWVTSDELPGAEPDRLLDDWIVGARRLARREAARKRTISSGTER